MLVSFVITEHDVFHSMSIKEPERFHDIVKLNGIPDNTLTTINWVPACIIPPNDNFKAPFDEWKFEVENFENYCLIPNWFNPWEAERNCRRKLSMWMRLHTITDDCKLKCGCIRARYR